MKNLGFMLIEVIIYITLFSIMIGGLLVSASLLMQNSYQGEDELVTTTELSFVIQKLTWALSGAKSLYVSSDNLSLYIQNDEIYNNEIVFRYNTIDQSLELKSNINGFFRITTPNVSVLSTQYEPTKFLFIPSEGGARKGVSVFLNIDGNAVEFNKYIQYANQ